jgi:hypothetical protein
LRTIMSSLRRVVTTAGQRGGEDATAHTIRVPFRHLSLSLIVTEITRPIFSGYEQ